MKRAAAVVVLLVVAALGWWLLRSANDEAQEAPAAASQASEPPRPADERSGSAVPIVMAPDVALPAAIAVAPDLHEPQILDGELTLDEDGTGISGRVLDANGRAVAGARVALIQDEWGIDDGFGQFAHVRTVSAADGSFHLAYDSPFEIASLRVLVNAEGWPPWVGRVVLLGGSSDVVLGPVQQLPMRLVVEDGSPLSDAVVRWEDSCFEESGRHGAAEAELSIVGRTDAEGRLSLPVFDNRRELSIVVSHPLHTGRHAVPLAEWRASSGHYEWTLSVAGGTAFDLRLTDWPAGWPVRPPGEWSGLSLSLAPYERHEDGSLTLRQATPRAPDSGSRGGWIVDGHAVASDLEAPAYRVSLDGFGGPQLLVDPWVTVPGVTSWTSLTPKYVPPPLEDSLTVEIEIVGAPEETVWSDWRWHLTATDRVEPERWYALRPHGKVRWPPFHGPVTLAISELGTVGVRTDVPPTGHYVFQVPAADALSVTGGLRADLSGLPRAPRPDETRVVMWPDESKSDTSTQDGPEAHGVPVGSGRVRVVAPWVSDLTQPVVIEPGRTAVVRAMPAPPPSTGRVRGRVELTGDGSWLRVHEASFTGADGSVEQTLEISRLSFAAELQPGSYHGHVSLGQVPARARFGTQHDPDLVPHDFVQLDATPLEASFICDVAAGHCTDVIVKLDATQLCLLRVVMPPEDLRATSSQGQSFWYYELRRDGVAEPIAKSAIRVWPAEAVTLRVGAGRYTASVELKGGAPIGAPAQNLQGSVDVAEGDRDLTLELHETAPPVQPAEGKAR